MPYLYSNPDRQSDPHALPDVMITQFTAHEVAETMEDEVWEFMKRPAFCLANMNSRDRDRMLDAMVEELGIEGGYMWAYCLPGCLPDSGWFGPFATMAEAEADMRDFSETYA